MPRTYVTRGVSFTPDLLSAAEAVARADRRSFSSYVQNLVAADLGKNTEQKNDAPAVKFARRAKAGAKKEAA